MRNGRLLLMIDTISFLDQAGATHRVREKERGKNIAQRAGFVFVRQRIGERRTGAFSEAESSKLNRRCRPAQPASPRPERAQRCRFIACGRD
jgi:hypothetical protein